MPEHLSNIVSLVSDYFGSTLAEHGPVAAGVDWNSEASQSLRFDKLLEVVEDRVSFSINDFGCGYGALVGHLESRGVEFEYTGYDVSPEMMAVARRIHAGKPHVRWASRFEELEPADFTVASGVFNVKFDIAEDVWRQYTLDSIESIASVSTEGMAFNILTKYSDAEFMKPHLFYADPFWLFDEMQRKYSRWVRLAHDYRLFEFTMTVQLEGANPGRAEQMSGGVVTPMVGDRLSIRQTRAI